MKNKWLMRKRTKGIVYEVITMLIKDMTKINLSKVTKIKAKPIDTNSLT